MSGPQFLRTDRNNRLYPPFWHSRYHHLTRLRHTLEAAIREYAPRRSDLVLVDMGCGSKPYRPLFQNNVQKYIGVDIPGNPDADIALDPSGSTPLEDGQADLVLSSQVLEHVASSELYLAECRRVLKPGGLVFLSTHGHWPYHPDPNDYWRWTSEGLDKQLRDSGFIILRCRGIVGLPATGFQLLQDVVNARLPFWLKPINSSCFQLIVRLTDRLTSPGKRNLDAGTFLIVARKPGDDLVLATNDLERAAGLPKAGVAGGAGETPKAETPICVASPNKNAYSETFIRTHVERLPCPVVYLYGSYAPQFTGDDIALNGGFVARGVKFVLTTALGLRPEYFWEKAVVRLFRRRGVKAVLAEYGPTGSKFTAVCEKTRIPLIVHFHGFDAHHLETLQTYRADYLRMFERAAAIVVVSEFMRESVIKLGAPPDNIFLIPYGVEAPPNEAAGPRFHRPTFLSVGRFVDKKAPHLTLLAFHRVREKHLDQRLVMVGDGPLLEACRQLAASLDLNDSVTFTGALPHEQVKALMTKANVFVQHSLQPGSGDCEGTPVSILEASATGLPVVSTRHAGIVQAVIHGETGFLVAERDWQSMAEFMLRLIEQPSLAEKMGQAGKTHIQNHYATTPQILKLWRVIDDAIQGRRA